MAEKKFLIENYGKKSTFASFLPGISGEKGIPIWCYYVNRGQCVSGTSGVPECENDRIPYFCKKRWKSGGAFFR